MTAKPKASITRNENAARASLTKGGAGELGIADFSASVVAALSNFTHNLGPGPMKDRGINRGGAAAVANGAQHAILPPKRE
jgi:hypothetical protein